jgi:hypothetical protein
MPYTRRRSPVFCPMGAAVAIFAVSIYGLSGLLAGSAVIGGRRLIEAVAPVRSVQSEIARKEYQPIKPFTSQ